MSFTRKANNGGYYGYAVYYDKDRKRHFKSAGKFRLKKDAVASAIKLEQELNKANINLRDISFSDYYLRWYETYKSSGLSYITSNRYKTFSKVIRGYFKDKMLKDIRRSDYQQFINWYGKSHAMSSVSKINGAIR